MIPVNLVAQADGTVRYTAESLRRLRQLKTRTIAEAQAVMRRAVDEENLSRAAAVQRYHDELDLERKEVVADFRTPLNRLRAFEALRDAGYPIAGAE
ncbi:hypothetical protein [Microlunatus parietis]|uniref:Uncharacterized protein n=1 Tax=Microlunatus parietis TaxID=682979 RepID=A0A7Y9LBZ5_9ACTN|nr:hypothetical protein [Microlunatus parietis]NYE71353.1 hypothetical protein [Microlunatus parietis]